MAIDPKTSPPPPQAPANPPMLNDLLRRLLEPSASLPAAQRPQARLLSGLLLILSLFFALTLSILGLRDPGQTLLLVVPLLLSGLAYGL